MCRAGKTRMGWLVREVNRRLRRKAKEDLKQGKIPEDKASVPYTD